MAKQKQILCIDARMACSSGMGTCIREVSQAMVALVQNTELQPSLIEKGRNRALLFNWREKRLQDILGPLMEF